LRAKSFRSGTVQHLQSYWRNWSAMTVPISPVLKLYTGHSDNLSGLSNSGTRISWIIPSRPVILLELGQYSFIFLPIWRWLYMLHVTTQKFGCVNCRHSTDAVQMLQQFASCISL
jgi:hypothetical protein